jgi:hypothetical protein
MNYYYLLPAERSEIGLLEKALESPLSNIYDFFIFKFCNYFFHCRWESFFELLLTGVVLPHLEFLI